MIQLKPEWSFMFNNKVTDSMSGRRNSEDGSVESEKKYFVSLDIGTTSVRSYVFDTNFDVVGKARFMIQINHDENGGADIEPDPFFENIVQVIKDSISNAKIKVTEVLCLGICTQRSSFVTWDQNNGKIFHPINTWKDTRSKRIAHKVNNGWISKIARFLLTILYFFIRIDHLNQARNYKMEAYSAPTRLLWLKKHNKELRNAMKSKTAKFGMIDTWLLKRLKNQSFSDDEHLTDISSASITALFDPFKHEYSGFLMWLFGFNKEMFPKVVNNDHDFGNTDAAIFGVPIKISALTTDQSAAVWGNCCFQKGDVKLTLGTGTVLSINTGEKCQSLGPGFHPLVAWRLFNKRTQKNETINVLESGYEYSNLIIQWAQTMGLFSDPRETSDIAYSVEDPGGAYFLPINTQKQNELMGFVGMTPDTSREQLVRALLEGLAFTVAEMFLKYKNTSEADVKIIRINGGISNNDFLCQTIANLCQVNIERPSDIEMSVQGITYMSAYNMGLLKNFEEIGKLYKTGRIFHPKRDKYLSKRMNKWLKYFKNY